MKGFTLRLVLFKTEAQENLEMAYCKNHMQIKLQQRDILFAFQPRKPSYLGIIIHLMYGSEGNS